jgi:hypothetical protein
MVNKISTHVVIRRFAYHRIGAMTPWTWQIFAIMLRGATDDTDGVIRMLCQQVYIYVTIYRILKAVHHLISSRIKI